MPAQLEDNWTDHSPTVDVSPGDADLLNEIRDNYRYAFDYWSDARNERQIDMRYICGDPWDPKDRKEREDNGRPVVNHDELNQYVNATIGSALQNKRGVKIEPDGEGASEKTAEYRQNRIRAIEYRSKASGIYIGALRNTLEGSYGFWRIKRRWIRGSFNQEIVIKPIPNPDSVLYDPGAKEQDWSDAEWLFVLEPLSKAQFQRQYPKAKKTSFSAEDMRIEGSSDWIKDNQILVAEYWKVIKTPTVLREGGQKRIEHSKKVVQYVTNGFEILEQNEEPGEEIPIIPVIGLERYVDLGKGPQRKLFSMIRLGRDPQMSLAFLNSQQTEEASLSPKTPWVGYTGQFESDNDAWKTSHKKAHAFLQADPAPDSAGGQILALPTRVPFTPNFQAYEVAKDSCRRAIQAAMGITPLPTAAQRNNEKSGVALERIQEQQTVGSSHFIDGLERAIIRTGRIIESWLPVVDDTETMVPIRDQKDEHHMVRINTDGPYLNDKGQPEHYPVEEGPHATTISVGPSNDSQRQEADEFLNNLIANVGKLPIPPQSAAHLLALAIKLKQLGPLGDEMAETISPDQQAVPPQAQALLAQAQGQIQALTMENQALQAEKAAKVIDNEYKLKLEDKRLEAQIAMAEVNTKAQQVSERAQWVFDMWKELHGQAHEVGLQAQEQAHERDQATQQQAHEKAVTDQQAAIASAQSAQDADQQQQAAENAQPTKP